MIAFSGIDCCGKSTQIAKICEEYRNNNIKYEVIWSRGGYTPGIELLKKIIRGGKTKSKSSRLESSAKINENPKKRKLLFIAGLMDLWRYYTFTLRLKELFGKKIICDRYIWDTYIDYKMKYPDYDFENGFWWRLTLKTMLKPKAAIVMYIPAEVSMYRSSLKVEPFPEPIEVRQERINWYMKEIELGRWKYKIDAGKPIDEVYAQIKENISFE